MSSSSSKQVQFSSSRGKS